MHLYGKASAGAGRKLGHVTARGANLEEALARARRAAARFEEMRAKEDDDLDA